MTSGEWSRTDVWRSWKRRRSFANAGIIFQDRQRGPEFTNIYMTSRVETNKLCLRVQTIATTILKIDYKKEQSQHG